MAPVVPSVDCGLVYFERLPGTMTRRHEPALRVPVAAEVPNLVRNDNPKVLHALSARTIRRNADIVAIVARSHRASWRALGHASVVQVLDHLEAAALRPQRLGRAPAYGVAPGVDRGADSVGLGRAEVRAYAEVFRRLLPAGGQSEKQSDCAFHVRDDSNPLGGVK